MTRIVPTRRTRLAAAAAAAALVAVAAILAAPAANASPQWVPQVQAIQPVATPQAGPVLQNPIQPINPNPGPVYNGPLIPIPPLQIQPDLTVSHADFLQLLGFGLVVEIKNVGAGNAAATNLKTFVTVNGQLTKTLTPVPALGPGESAQVTVTTGQQLFLASNIGVRVDDPNQVAETNEGNNSYIVK